MIRLTLWNPGQETKAGDLTIDPRAITAVTEYEDYEKQVARVSLSTGDYFNVCDFNRNVAERIALAKSGYVSDMERYKP